MGEDQITRDAVKVICMEEIEKCRAVEHEELKEMRDDVKKILAFSVTQAILLLAALVGFLGAKVIHLPNAAAAAIAAMIMR